MGEAPVSRHTAAPIGSSWVRLAPNSATAALRETAKANKQGLYDELKANLDTSVSDATEWREGEGGRIKPADLASMALIVLGALPEAQYPKAAFLRNNPNLLFSSKGRCVELYNDFLLTQTGVSRQVENSRRKEIADDLVKAALTLMKDLPKLFDLIYQIFPDAYNSASPGFGRIGCVKTLDPVKWKNNKQS
jgi:hypothetical protein